MIRREALTVHELDGVVNLLLGAASSEQKRYVLDFPREAFTQAIGPQFSARDPRLSPVAVQLWRRLSTLLALLARVEEFLSSQGRAGLTARDRQILASRFERLSRDANSVAQLSALQERVDLLWRHSLLGRFANERGKGDAVAAAGLLELI